jgi:hypothetical protein
MLLQALYAEVGFARSLLAYELPDGRLKLIDGHLRRDLAPDMEADVEVLDVNEDEARALLLSIDPLAGLAQTQEQIHRRLLEITPSDFEELKAAWRATAESCLEELSATPAADARLFPERGRRPALEQGSCGPGREIPPYPLAQNPSTDGLRKPWFFCGSCPVLLFLDLAQPKKS